MNRRNAIIVSLIVIVLIVLVAVAYVYIPRAPTTPTVLVVGTTEREETMDPSDSYNYFSVNMLQNTMATLLTYSQSGDGTLEPMLLTEVPTAQNGGISSDGLTYTLKLRSGATFEDGTAIDADTIKHSIDRAVGAKFDAASQQDRLAVPSFLLDAIDGANGYVTAYSGLTKDPPTHTQAEVDAAWANYVASGVEVVDATTAKIHMGRVWSPMQYLLAFTSMAPVNPNNYPADEFVPDPLEISASGPYQLSVFVSGERAELVRNTRFFGTPAAVEKVVIRFYETDAGLALAMATGEIDVAYRNLHPQAFQLLSVDARFKAEQGDSPVIRYLVFNSRDPPFSDVRLRQALAYAVDRGQIVKTVFLDTTQPLYSLIPRGMFGHEDVFQSAYPRDLARARALLTAAGYSEANKLAITLWYTPARYGTTEADVAVLLQSQWQETGLISVTLNSQEWGTYRQSFAAGQFRVFLLGWFPDYLDPDNYVFPFLHYASGGTTSFGSWYQNATLDQLIELQAQQSDPTQRAQTLSDIQDALAADVPYIPLWQTAQQVVYKKSVTGVILDDSQFFRYFTIRFT
ncbi:MAG: peptide ABC transporter substrate-binding protein [Euryarchaeota archaeon]|nr:peptide ABC transporter substrate-binding protein [Euryarchaeota archaeon]